MRRIGWLFAGALVLAPIPRTASAQQQPERGKWSLSADVFGRSRSSFGVWRSVSNNVDLGIEVGVSSRDFTSRSVRVVADTMRLTSGDESTNRNISVNPELKLFVSQAQVRPFVLLGAGIGDASSTRVQSFSTEFAKSQTSSSTYSAHVGIGVDWFPVREASLGIRSLVSWTRIDSSFMQDDGTTVKRSIDTQNRSTTVGTSTTSIILHIYF